MADPKELANKARATLARALEALQQDGIPEKLMDIAEPIAKTMGILHRVQKDEGTKAEVKTALELIRTTLDDLQTIEVDHPSVDEAMEGVAGSLSKLFALSRAMPERQQKPVEKQVEPPTVRKPRSGPPRASSKPAPKSRPAPKIGGAKTDVIAAAPIQAIGGSNEPVAPAPQPAAQPAAQPAPQPAAQPAQPAAPQPAFAAPTPQAAPQTGFQSNVTVPIAQVPVAQPPIAQPPVPAEFGQTLPVNAPSPIAAQPAAPQPAAQPAPRAERVPGMTDAPVPATGAKRVEVELGAHSTSNFYKGLSGNDVIDHGGIFVATYQVPKVGDPIALRVLFPGDLEFEGDCIVQWTREVRGEGSEPGFGAKFTRISDDGRQLAYRYVRNREPMFYDDM